MKSTMNRLEIITRLQDCAEDESLPDHVRVICNEGANHLLQTPGRPVGYWPTEKGYRAVENMHYGRLAV